MYLPVAGPTAPILDLGVGYEWFTVRLADAGAHSTRSYAGPVFLSANLAAPFAIGEHWTLGPSLALMAGTFTAESLETSVSSKSQAVPARAVHLWLQLGLRPEFSSGACYWGRGTATDLATTIKKALDLTAWDGRAQLT